MGFGVTSTPPRRVWVDFRDYLLAQAMEQKRLERLNL